MIFFWSLVSNCRVTRVARGVLWVGLGFIIQHGGKFCPRLDYTTGTCYLLLIDEMGGGMEGYRRRRQDAFCWKSRTDRNLPLLA